MLGLFQKLMPREERFFPLFELHTTEIVAGAKALRAMLEGGETIEHYCAEVAAHETAADKITRDVMLAVRRSFITPFDRSDIKDLIQSMDDAIDQMNQTCKTIRLYEVTDFDPLMRELGDLIVSAAETTARAVPLLRSIGTHAPRLSVLTESITKLEDRSDVLHDQGLKQLYRAHGASNPMAFWVGSQVYGRLEKVVDSFEDVADEINAIVIEHL